MGVKQLCQMKVHQTPRNCLEIRPSGERMKIHLKGITPQRCLLLQIKITLFHNVDNISIKSIIILGTYIF